MEFEKIFKALAPENSVIQDGKIKYKGKGPGTLISETFRGYDIKRKIDLYRNVFNDVLEFKFGSETGDYPSYHSMKQKYDSLTREQYTAILCLVSLRFHSGETSDEESDYAEYEEPSDDPVLASPIVQI